jgi:ABC-2 type transport system permease protein
MGDRIGFRQFLGLYAQYARMDLAWLLRDTRVAIMAIIAETFSTAAGVAGVFLLAWRFSGIGGMSRWEVLFMLGYVACVDGLSVVFFGNCNTQHLCRRIGRGQFDHMIVQPLPYGVQLMTEGFIPFTGCQRLLCGIGVTVWAVHGMGLTPDFSPPGLLWWLTLAACLAVSLAVIIGLSYLLSAAAFWKPVAYEEITYTLINDLTGVLANYPLSGMPGGVQVILISVVPSGLLGWFPVCALLGKPPLGLSSFYPLIAALVIWALALFLLRKGFRYYVRHGSVRYKAVGHRG